MPNKRMAVGLSPDIPLPIRRSLQQLSQIAQGAHEQAQSAKAIAESKIGRSSSELDFLAQQMRSRLQPGGSAPLPITGLTGVNLTTPQLGLLSGTHAGRLAGYPAKSYPAGMLFYETDTGKTYRDTGIAWVFAY